ncbi:MAG TPA: hypothetical protein V6C65_06505 [Allocoleopsis sp.]
MKGWQWLRVGLQVGVLVGLTGCSGLTTIEKIQQHPHRQWFNNQVQLRGKVVDRVPLINAGVYQLEDSTGKIWILTTNASPPSGEQLRVRGTVRFESIPIEGLELGEAYIEEQHREVIQPQEP